MNEPVLYALAEVGATLAGFSGLVVTFRFQGIQRWSPTELRVLWLLIGNSLLVVLFSLLPVSLALFGWPADVIWMTCAAILGTWFLSGSALGIRGDLADRANRRLVTVPVITPLLYVVLVVALAMGVALWLSAFAVIVPHGQGIYVLGLITLIAFAAAEFLFFIGLMSQRDAEH